MTKPLELTEYPKDDGGDYRHPVFGYKIWPDDLEVFADQKRLTNAELAAEYWQERTFAEMKSADLESCHFGEGEVAGRIFNSMQRNRRRASVLRRFATLPHYDEDVTP